MIAPIRIPQYNDVILVFPWYEQQILEEGPELIPLEIERATELSIQYSCNNGLTWKDVAVENYSVFGNRINVTVKAGTVHGSISFRVSAKYRGQNVSSSWLKCVEFVKWNNTENYTEFLQGAPYLLPSNIAILTMPNVSAGTDEAIDFLMETKQDKEDAALETTAKTVVGAINELNNKKVDVDLALDIESENPIANKPVAEAIAQLEARLDNNDTTIGSLGDTYMLKDASNYEGDVPLVSPSISSVWKVTNSGDGEIELTDNSISLERGASVDYTGTFLWNIANGKKNPKSCDGSFGTTLPSAGESSAEISAEGLTSNTTYTVNLYAPKGGLEVSGSKVVKAVGSDKTTASASVTFYYRRFWGVSSNPDVSIQTLSSELSNSKSKTTTFDCSGGNYFYYAYPKALGDTSWNVGGLSFTGYEREEVNITNEYGATVTYFVYRSAEIQTGSNIKAIIT